MSRILALAPHPDDIEIGCGGTLAVHAARGDEVHLFVATEGGVGGSADTRKSEQQRSSEILGVTKIHWGGYSDTCLPQQAMALMETLEKLVMQVQPDTVYVNHRDDTHQDHRVLAQVANSVTRYVPNVLAYETLHLSVLIQPCSWISTKPWHGRKRHLRPMLLRWTAPM